MPRVILALLLATTAASPALAQSTVQERRVEREQARSERQQAREDRREQNSGSRAEASERQAPARETERPATERRADRRPQVQRDRPLVVQDVVPGDRPSIEQRRTERDSVANWRQDQREELRQSRGDRIADRVRRSRVTPPADARPDRPAPPVRTASRSNRTQWKSSWHNDRRHNWRDYRRRHGSLFRLGFYFDPFGWNYQRYGRGWRLWPSYYQSSYWLNDPMMYRLPYAPHPYRWIRYWDDALLVDTYTGEVVDVVHDFFW